MAIEKRMLYAMMAFGALLLILAWAWVMLPLPHVACAADAKICPDGTVVGRIPPDCNVAPCPGDNYSWIENFDDCARAGFPIMESYPRQCTTPDGRVFVEEGVSEIYRYPGDCEAGFFCKYGVCTEMGINISCSGDSDCILINNELGFSCCWAGQCEEIDYSEGKWVAERGMVQVGKGKILPFY